MCALADSAGVHALRTFKGKRLVSTKQAIYNYDALGRLKEVTFSTGGKITYNYDAMGNRSSVVEVAAGCCFNWRGAWSSATTYFVGDAVVHNGSSYLAIADNSNSQPPSANWDTLAAKGDTGATGPAGAEGLNWRGTWSSATAYVVDDAVTLNGTSYVAVANNTNSQPPSANWNTLAAKGDAGSAGSTGPAGAKGLNWQGTWSSATAYVIDDAVTLNGTSYVAVANNTNSQPPSANWNTLAAKGDQGPAGADGTTSVKASFKTSNTSRANTTTLADDPDLVLNVDANKTYHFTGFLYATGGGGDLKMTFVGPSGATLSWKVDGIDNGSHSGLLTGGGTTVLDIANGERGWYVSGKIVVSSTAGQLKLQWAQNTSNGTATNLLAGSCLQLIQM